MKVAILGGGAVGVGEGAFEEWADVVGPGDEGGDVVVGVVLGVERVAGGVGAGYEIVDVAGGPEAGSGGAGEAEVGGLRGVDWSRRLGFMVREEEVGMVEDAYRLSAAGVEEPPAGLWKAFGKIGPGLILAASIVGTGELIATTNLGAKVGFSLLWLVIVSCFIKVFAQVELGRHAICTGQTTFEAFGELPGVGKLLGPWWIVMMLSTQLQLGGMVGGIGQAMHLAMPGVSPWVGRVLSGLEAGWGEAVVRSPELPWAVLVAVGTSLLLAVGGYGLIERGSTVLVAGFTLVTLLCVILLPAAGHAIEWGEVGRGLSFRMPGSSEALVAALAVLGITGVGATELVTYPYWCVEKGYARKTGAADGSGAWLGRARGWMRVLRLDAWVSMVIYTIATVAFYFLGAAVLHGRRSGLPGSVGGMLEALSEMYVPVMGPRLGVAFIVVGVFSALYSTLYAATGANSRTLADFAHVQKVMDLSDGARRRRVVRMLCVLFPILNLVIFVAIRNPVRMVLIAGCIQAMTLPMLAGAAVYLRYRRTHAMLVPGRVWDVMLWISLGALCVAAGYSLYDAMRQLVGAMWG